jgi:nitrous oxidase accessory protein
MRFSGASVPTIPMTTVMLLAAFVFALRAGTATAAERIVPAQPGELIRVIANAQPGDHLILEAGRHDGPLVLDRPIILEGRDNAEVIGNGKGSTIAITGEDISIRGLRVTGSGNDHAPIDSGIRIAQTAKRIVVEQNVLVGNLHGITIHGGTDTIIRNNTILGRKDRRLNDRGNGIYVWNAPGASSKVRHALVATDLATIQTECISQQPNPRPPLCRALRIRTTVNHWQCLDR